MVPEGLAYNYAFVAWSLWALCSRTTCHVTSAVSIRLWFGDIGEFPWVSDRMAGYCEYILKKRIFSNGHYILFSYLFKNIFFYYGICFFLCE